MSTRYDVEFNIAQRKMTDDLNGLIALKNRKQLQLLKNNCFIPCNKHSVFKNQG